MSVLITGGNGFIGSHLADRLIEKGEDVTLLDIKFNDNTKDIDCEKITADVRTDSLNDVIKNKNYIFHFAALSRVAWGQDRPIECLETNSMGTQRVLEAIKKENPNTTMFFGSSREVYGEPKDEFVKETHQKNPISIYGVTKLASEGLVNSYRKYFGLKTVVFRFSNVYGSTRDLKERVIPKFVVKAINNEPLELYGGDQVLDFTFIEDTLNGIISAKENSENIIGEDFHFVTSKGTSVKQLAEKIVELTGSNSEIIEKDSKNFDVKNFIGDYSKAKKILNWEPKVSLEEGLKKTSEMYKNK